VADYTYLAVDLMSNTILAELPLREVTFSQDLNQAGSFHGVLPLGDPRIKNLDPAGSTQPGRTAIYVDRDGTLVWGGVIWTRRYSARRGRGHELASSGRRGGESTGGHIKDHALELDGMEFLSYFGRRLISDDLNYTADPLTIVRNLISYAAAKPGGDIGIVLDSTLSGLSITRSYDSFAMTPIDQAINLLSSETTGFDYAIDVQYDAGIPKKYLHLSYPRRGQIAGLTGHVFDYPGNIVDYVWPEDATSMAVTVINTGSGNNATKIRSSASNPGLIDAKYPLLESTRAYSDVSDQATLDSRTIAELLVRDAPFIIPELTIRADREPFLGAYITGDDVRVRVTDDPRFPAKADGSPGYDSYCRLTSISVRPPDEFPEAITLHLVTL
jgi:hypothetical protein